MRVADLGSGAGAASLSLAWRSPGALVFAVEREPSLLALLNYNITTNGFVGRVTPVHADVRKVGQSDLGGSADLIMINPPYLAEGSFTPSKNAIRAVANNEGDTPLTEWIAAARRLSRNKTKLVLIHRADRLADILAEIGPSFGDIHVHPLWPCAGEAAKRVIITAVFGSKAPFSLDPGLILHRPDGAFTPETEAILRHGERLLIV